MNERGRLALIWLTVSAEFSATFTGCRRRSSEPSTVPATQRVVRGTSAPTTSALPARQGATQPDGGSLVTPKISHVLDTSEVVKISRRYLVGKLELQDERPPVVELSGNKYIVTFPHVNPPRVRGPSYDARLTVDAVSGDVLQCLAGS